ncbi:MAG: hypothetical protein K2L84_08600 [Muribaculaceae bacterium]|nr:hypothetical protein [Muribaculaceae bacterium]
MISIPLYLRYFSNNEVLGIWFTIINVLNWLLTFDLGIGNGLRNNLTYAISKNDTARIKELISSAYILLGALAVTAAVVFFGISGFISWNSFFNIKDTLLPDFILEQCVNITMAGIVTSFFLRLVIAINYALQKSALNNLIGFISAILTFAYLLIVEPSESAIVNFRNLSVYQAVAINIPLIIATIIAFSHKSLRGAVPSFRHYNNTSAKAVLSLGLTFLFVQLLYMVITVTNEWFISKYYNPRYCVDYQIYYKLFSFVGMIFMLTLTPIWSAITKAYAEKRYQWIIKLRKFLYLAVLAVAVLQIICIPLMPAILKLWLGDRAIVIDYSIVCVFVCFSIIYIWNAVQSVIVSGLGQLKLQVWGYSFAAIFKISAIIFLSQYFGWVLVMAATCIGLLPYSIAQPILINKHFAKLLKHT